MGHLDEAEFLYKRALEAFPEDAPAHHALAKVFAFQQRWVCLSERGMGRVPGGGFVLVMR